jgi:hypothetical protein
VVDERARDARLPGGHCCPNRLRAELVDEARNAARVGDEARDDVDIDERCRITAGQPHVMLDVRSDLGRGQGTETVRDGCGQRDASPPDPRELALEARLPDEDHRNQIPTIIGGRHEQTEHDERRIGHAVRLVDGNDDAPAGMSVRRERRPDSLQCEEGPGRAGRREPESLADTPEKILSGDRKWKDYEPIRRRDGAQRPL